LPKDGRKISWLIRRKIERKPVHKRFLTRRNRNARRYWRRLRKRAYLAMWRQRLRVQSRCHECGGDSDFNAKKGKPFYYCAACRDKMREWHKLIMRRWRAAKK
jgi:hypothetical protein